MQQTAEVNLCGFLYLMWRVTLLGFAFFIPLISLFLFFLLNLSTFSTFYSCTFKLSTFFLFCFVSRTGERGEEISKNLKSCTPTVFVTRLMQNPHIFLRLSSMRKAEGEVPQHKPWSIFSAIAYWREHCQDICRGVCRSGCSYKHTILILRFSKNCKLNLSEPAAELAG